MRENKIDPTRQNESRVVVYVFIIVKCEFLIYRLHITLNIYQLVRKIAIKCLYILDEADRRALHRSRLDRNLLR